MTGFRRATRACAAAAALLAASLIAPSPAAATDGSLACTVPTGYVYDWAGRTTKCSPGYTYRLRVPADLVWSCAGPYVSVPSGFTYDLTQSSSGQCDPNNPGLWKYQLRVPVTGLWACMVPSGFTYDAVMASNRCNPSSPSANFYRLRRL